MKYDLTSNIIFFKLVMEIEYIYNCRPFSVLN